MNCTYFNFTIRNIELSEFLPNAMYLSFRSERNRTDGLDLKKHMDSSHIVIDRNSWTWKFIIGKKNNFIFAKPIK